jgi:hydroxymethylbilane synthase
MKLTIGTRGSALALWQANHIRDRLLNDTSGAVEEVTLKIIKTRGDRILDRALSKVGGKALFVKEIEDELLRGSVDLAVHSMKDMPAKLPEGLMIGCVPPRADPTDAWVLPDGGEALSVLELPPRAVVGTSSLRRASQLMAMRSDLVIVPIRGNVDTRLRKLDEGVDGLMAIVLASAGLKRMGLGHRITRAFSASEMCPAVGQGALAIETRLGDGRVNGVVTLLEDPLTRYCTTAERAFLATVEGNCQVPIGGYATIENQTLTLTGFVARPDGSVALKHVESGPANTATGIGQRVGDVMLQSGAREILDSLAEV